MTETAPSCHALAPIAALGQDFPGVGLEAQDPTFRDWFLAASFLWRIAQLDEPSRASAFRAAAMALDGTSDVNSPGPGRRSDLSGASPKRPITTVAELFVSAAAKHETANEWSVHLSQAVHEGAEYLERQGAFRLAYSLLSGLREAVGQLSQRDLGSTLALQGRIARQLGAMQTANDHYQFAERIGRRVRAPDLYVRALLGRGVVAATRGNYPDARTLFRQALRAAERSALTEHEAAAHNALLMAAVAAKDLESALTHGWSAFQLSAKIPDQQAEILINLAEVALLAGHPESALAACSEALRLTTIDRVLLAGYGSAAIAASRLGRRSLLDDLASDSLTVITRSSQQVDKAYTLVELAEAYAALAAEKEAGVYLALARQIAEPAGYFELLHRADVVDQLLARIRRPESTTHATVGNASDTKDSALQTELRETEFTLSRASRRVIQSLAELRS